MTVEGVKPSASSADRKDEVTRILGLSDAPSGPRGERASGARSAVVGRARAHARTPQAVDSMEPAGPRAGPGRRDVLALHIHARNGRAVTSGLVRLLRRGGIESRGQDASGPPASAGKEGARWIRSLAPVRERTRPTCAPVDLLQEPAPGGRLALHGVSVARPQSGPVPMQTPVGTRTSASPESRIVALPSPGDFSCWL